MRIIPVALFVILFLIIGIPNQLFGAKSPKSETVVFMVPRIIRTLKTTKPILDNLI